MWALWFWIVHILSWGGRLGIMSSLIHDKSVGSFFVIEPFVFVLNSIKEVRLHYQTLLRCQQFAMNLPLLELKAATQEDFWAIHYLLFLFHLEPKHHVGFLLPSKIQWETIGFSISSILCKETKSLRLPLCF